ncbi:hypothetical protein FraEuI1c_4725 [Pseudofrankia inefficax]|uniref:Uncharacterized protein n=1 Tax=Pseudofrankia inefficax (strain DSM 45817 / CECT 9037 / DDB 130130 / EuI1c) TaxID=298654 RepID=E3IZE6_PSEI1|nr:hypothetical protein FraEuI1c_4725 [Pseudofrankia inefficax]
MIGVSALRWLLLGSFRGHQRAETPIKLHDIGGTLARGNHAELAAAVRM